MLSPGMRVTFYIIHVKKNLNLNNYFRTFKVLDKHYRQKNI